MTLLALTPGVPAVVRIPHRRFHQCGGDVFEGSRPIDWDDANGLLQAWRDQAREENQIRRCFRLADVFTRAADDLADAIEDAARWRRAWGDV